MMAVVVHGIRATGDVALHLDYLTHKAQHSFWQPTPTIKIVSKVLYADS